MNTTINLSDFATPLVARDRFIKIAFGGFAGSGKTKTAADLIIGCYKDMGITKPLLIIDNEKGSRFLIQKFGVAGIDARAKDTEMLADVIQAFEFLRRGDIGLLFIDTLSKIWYRYVRDYKEKNRITFMSLEHWGKILPAWQEEFANRLVECSGNIVFTGRGGYSYEKEDDEVDQQTGKVKKGSFVRSDVKMKVAGETPFETDLNIWMSLEKGIDRKRKISQTHTAFVMKDRNDSPTSLDGKLFVNPTYKQFQPFIQYVLGVPVGKVAGPTSTENLAPTEDFGYYHRKIARETEVEKIRAEYDKFGIGNSSAVDKQLRVYIADKIFGTTSGTEIEKMDAEELKHRRVQLISLFAALANIEPAKRSMFVNAWQYQEPGELPFDVATVTEPVQKEVVAQPMNGDDFKSLKEMLKTARNKKSLASIGDRAHSLEYEGRITKAEAMEIIDGAEAIKVKKQKVTA